MNIKDFLRVHETNLEVGKRYFLRTRYGSAEVQVLEDKGIEGVEVEVKRGGFDPPMKSKVRNGDTMIVPPSSGDWYESK